jgi:Tol biopolymer transport system component
VDDLKGRGTSTRLTFGGHHEMPIWTPDGQRVIDASGTPNANLFWRAADGSGEEERLTTSSKRQLPFDIYLGPLADGRRRIPVSKGGGQMMAVSIDTSGPEPKIGTPRVLFSDPYQGAGDVAPDGRFLLLKPTRYDSPARTVELVLNWFEDLQAKVPLR